MKTAVVDSNCCRQASEALPEGLPKVVLVGRPPHASLPSKVTRDGLKSLFGIILINKGISCLRRVPFFVKVSPCIPPGYPANENSC